MREAIVFRELEREPLRLGERRERVLAEDGGLLLAQRGLRAALRRLAIVLPRLVDLTPGLPVGVHREPPRDAERPGEHLAARRVHLSCAVHLQEGLLHEVLGAG